MGPRRASTGSPIVINDYVVTQAAFDRSSVTDTAKVHYQRELHQYNGLANV